MQKNSQFSCFNPETKVVFNKENITRSRDILSAFYHPDDEDKRRYNQEQSNFTLIGRVVKIIHAHETGNGLFSYSED